MWYVVQVETGREERAKELIERAAADADAVATDSEPSALEECMVARYETMKKVRGAWVAATGVLFPGYVIVISQNPKRLKRALVAMPAFARILEGSNGFSPLTSADVAWIEAFTQRGSRMVGMSEGVIEGDSVVILNGPLLGHAGWIRRIDRHKRLAFLELTMFGRTIQTKVGLSIVRKTNSQADQ